MKTCWLLALAGLLGLAGITHAGSADLTNLLLPQLFGHDTHPCAYEPAGGPQAQPLPAPVVAMPDDEDSEWLADVLMDSISFCRMLFGMNHPEIDMIAEVVVRLATAPKDADGTPPYRATAPEVLPMPRQVAGSAPCAPCAPCCPLAGSCGPCGVKVGCASTFACPQDGKACGTAADKACKCCPDCKDCSCGKAKKAAAPSEGAIVVNERNFSVMPCPPSVVLMPADAPPGMVPPLPRMLVSGLPVPPVDGYAASVGSMMPPGMHPLAGTLPSMPMCPPVEDLKELIRQRQMITAAIEQIEKELVRMAQQRQAMQGQGMAVAHNAQKVHLVTEHFEAHCDAAHCVEGNPHRVVLEGDVRLTCKKLGPAVRIEAPCVVVDMKDGTFRVQAPPAPVMQPAQWLVPMATPGGYR